MMLPGKRRRDRASQQEKRWKPRGEQAIRVGLMIALLGLLTILFPTQQSYEYNAFREGTIAQEEVIAPETFSVHKSEDQYQQEVAESRRNIPPVLHHEDMVQPDKQEAFVKFLDTVEGQSGAVLTDSLAQALRLAHPEIGPISESTLNFLLPLSQHPSTTRAQLLTTVDSILQNTYQNGILANRADLSEENYDEVTLIRNDSETQISLAQLVDIEAFTHNLQQTIEQQLPEAGPTEIKSGYELVVAYLIPNLTYDSDETHKRREEAAHNISTTKGTVLKGERIVDEHDRITSEHIDKLKSLVDHVNQRHKEDPFINIIQRGASTTLCALILAIFFGYLNLFHPPLYRQTANIVLFGIILLMPTAVAYYASQSDIVSPFLVPVALSAMLATVLFDAEIGMVVTLATTALCSSILGELQHGIVFLVTGIIGAFSVRQVRHRRDFYRSIVYLVVTYALTISATVGLLFTYASTSEFVVEVRQDLLIGIFSACASSILTIGLLPIFESIFSVVTPITLLELSDLNRSLLRNLAIRAPGTYSHSMNMANISEAAATAIGADPLLVRVGCYYHD
ncbi:MAG: HDIG domain-containing protein, partial [Candidatus Latescibacteria bacterium]|nr:HDIG domain-containing protein [Candidatus Latescibacterota bacterium]